VVLRFVVVTVAQVGGTLASISRPVGHLRDRMNDVGAGQLDVQARIDGLDTFGELSSSFNHMVDGLKQRELLKETFGRYVTQQVADEILAGRVRLGGERRTATVLFSDIRGFTTLSEQLTPEEVVAFLNEFLEMMVDCVLEHGGVLDKFIGDAVLAVFGVPVSRGSVEADARAAVACARAMGERLAVLNEARVAAGKAPIRIGIGVHTGELVAGNIGSPRRMQYTVIGDTVNVGSRLESLTKDHHRRTLLSGATAGLVGDSVPLVALGTATVRGRQEPLALFGLKDEAA
jgi:adenylate cyclase